MEIREGIHHESEIRTEIESVEPSESEENETESSSETETETVEDESETESSSEELETETSGDEIEESGTEESTDASAEPNATIDETISDSGDIYDSPSVSGNGSQLGQGETISEVPYISEEFQTQVLYELSHQNIHIVCGNFILAVIAGIFLSKLILGHLK